ncbi:hypothetical protein F8M41_002219 [Gigaspora margarita]|uniref:Uncharacterized protein n=1 Tax=Gigaspora margarita TaxID=4874 RepID=A0A8H3XG73_GIGMA|nr:hypothetical protein F8M41_002219 [Gigaspora margarita]
MYELLKELFAHRLTCELITATVPNIDLSGLQKMHFAFGFFISLDLAKESQADDQQNFELESMSFHKNNEPGYLPDTESPFPGEFLQAPAAPVTVTKKLKTSAPVTINKKQKVLSTTPAPAALINAAAVAASTTAAAATTAYPIRTCCSTKNVSLLPQQKN